MDRDTSPNVASGLLIDDDLLEDIIYRVSALLTRAFAAAKTPRSKLRYAAAKIRRAEFLATRFTDLRLGLQFGRSLTAEIAIAQRRTELARRGIAVKLFSAKKTLTGHDVHATLWMNIMSIMFTEQPCKPIQVFAQPTRTKHRSGLRINRSKYRS